MLLSAKSAGIQIYASGENSYLVIASNFVVLKQPAACGRFAMTRVFAGGRTILGRADL